MNPRTLSLILICAVGLFGVLAFAFASCSHRRLPDYFPNGPDVDAWLQRHWQTERLAREQECLETEFPKLTEP